MPVYTYRREDGTTFDVRQSFSDDALTVCPSTGQNVVRIVQNAGVIFKGTGFYINDSKGASKQSLNGSNGKNGATSENGSTTSSESKSETTSAAPPSTSAASSAAD